MVWRVQNEALACSDCTVNATSALCNMFVQIKCVQHITPMDADAMVKRRKGENAYKMQSLSASPFSKRSLYRMLVEKISTGLEELECNSVLRVS